MIPELETKLLLWAMGLLLMLFLSDRVTRIVIHNAEHTDRINAHALSTARTLVVAISLGVYVLMSVVLLVLMLF